MLFRLLSLLLVLVLKLELLVQFALLSNKVLQGAVYGGEVSRPAEAEAVVIGRVAA